MRPGLSLGGFLNLQVASHFSVQADFLLHYKNSIVEQNATLGHNVYFGGEIPLYFLYHLRDNGRSAAVRLRNSALSRLLPIMGRHWICTVLTRRAAIRYSEIRTAALPCLSDMNSPADYS
jgi:hypothetical protein